MAIKKIYDLAVVTGTYQKGDETKNRYKNVGSILQKDDGSKFIMLDRSFNPAGVPFKEGSDTILLSMFQPKDDQGGGNAPAPAPRPAPAAKPPVDDSDIPF
jgi:hypothetical protein